MKSQTLSIIKSSKNRNNAAINEILYSINMMTTGLDEIIQTINLNRNPNFGGFYEDSDDEYGYGYYGSDYYGNE